MSTAGLYLSRVPEVRPGWAYLQEEDPDAARFLDIIADRIVREDIVKRHPCRRYALNSDLYRPLDSENALDRHERRRQEEAAAAKEKERTLIHDFRAAEPVQPTAPKKVLQLVSTISTTVRSAVCRR